MRFVLLLFALAFTPSVFAQSFLFTSDSVFRAENIRANKNQILLSGLDSKGTNREISANQRVYLIVFPDESIRYFFKQNTTRAYIDYKVLSPMPAWLKDSVFTGPADLEDFSKKLNSKAWLIDSSNIQFPFYGAAYRLNKFKKQSLTGIYLTVSVPLIFTAANSFFNKMPLMPIENASPALIETYNQQMDTYYKRNRLFTGLSLTGVLVGSIVWIDAYKHIGKAATHIEFAGTQLNLRIKL